METIDFDNNDQIRLLTNLREDIRCLLAAHSRGIWFRMLPKVFYMHFNRDIHLDFFAITNPVLFLDYIFDIITFDLPENLNDDFIVELNSDQPKISSTVNLKHKRETLYKMLQNATLEKRGAILREICIIDEYSKQKDEVSSSTTVINHEQVTLRLQKMRSMIDFCLRHLLQTSNEITENELNELYDKSNEFISDITPLIQRLSSSHH